MSSELRRQLRVALGPAVTGLQRAVALEIADDARWDDDWNYDQIKGRRSRAKLTELVIWTGAKDTNVVRNAIKRLAAAGWEFRIAIGKDKNGNPVFAVPGKAMTFRVPDFDVPPAPEPTEGVATATPEPQGVATATPMESKGYPYGEQGLPIGVAGATPPSLVSPCSSPKESPSTSSVAEESTDVSVTPTETEDGGGGGEIISSEDQNQNDTRAEALVAQLDFRGKAPDRQQQKQLRVLVAAALAAGWSEGGLRRYLDISDDRDVKNPAGLYAYRLNPERLPDAGEAEAISTALPPPCVVCQWKPGADTDPSVRLHPFGGPCPDCHPASVGQSTTQLPPVCGPCREQNPAAEFNIKFRQDSMSFTGAPCPRCHPDMVGGTGARATPHTADAYTSTSVNDLFAPRRGPVPGPKPMVAPTAYRAYQDPEDQSVYDRPL